VADETPMKRNKFGAIKTKLDGYTFDSKLEAAHYVELRLREKAGEITHLVVHPKYQLNGANGKPLLLCSARYRQGRQVSYTPDFDYLEHGQWIVIDTKGVDTDYARLKRALFEAEYGAEVELVRAKRSRRIG
jgi:hypothetical protein